MPVVSRILRGPRLEIRQSGDNTLFVAKSNVENGAENGPQELTADHLRLFYGRNNEGSEKAGCLEGNA